MSDSTQEIEGMTDDDFIGMTDDDLAGIPGAPMCILMAVGVVVVGCLLTYGVMAL